MSFFENKLTCLRAFLYSNPPPHPTTRMFTRHLFFKFFLFFLMTLIASIITFYKKKKNWEKKVNLDPRHGTLALDMEPSTLDPRQKDRLQGRGSEKKETLARKPHDFEKLRSPTNAVSDWCGAGSVNYLALETSIKPGILCLRASIWSHLICGRRLQMP